MKKVTTRLTRIFTLVLAAALMFGLCVTGANAATLKNVKHYDTYLCLGDSIAAGYGPYEGYEKIKGFERVDVAYHALVNDAVTADVFYPLARTGFRTQEIRYMLEQGYEGDDYMFLIANLKPDVVAEWKPVFEKAVKEADLVTLNVGSNDVMNYAYYRAYLAGNDVDESDLSQRISQTLAEAGSMGEAIQKLLDSAKSAGTLPIVVNAFIEGLFEGYQHFRQNWDPLVKDILDANPNTTLVAVGLFNPIKTAEWYMDAVVWTFNNGVIKGTSGSTFSPNNKITREQMVAILYRFSGAEGARADLSKITDAANISAYAKPAVAWAVKNGVVNGFEDGTFRPKGNATRAQMAAIIARFDKLDK